MILGHIQGPVKYFENTGAMNFVDRGALKVNGKNLDANDGGPCITDWTGDGKLDLLLGDDGGSVRLFESKAKGSLDLVPGKPAFLIKSTSNAWEPRKTGAKTSSGLSINQPGARTKPYAADWNSDGKLDLIVGDYLQIAANKKPLTAAQKKELASARKETQGLGNKLSERYRVVQAKVMKKLGIKSFDNMTREKMDAFSKAYAEETEKDPDFRKLQERNQALYRRIGELEGRPQDAGFVWVYLRK